LNNPPTAVGGIHRQSISKYAFAFQLALALMCCFIGSRADVLTVGQNQFSSLQSAIATAKPGDVIQVQAGTYDGQFILDKPLTLEGIGKPILRGAGRGSVVIVTADRCAIRGFIIERSGSDLTAEDSGLLLKSNDNVIEDNELRDALYGIYLFNSHHNTIRRNAVYGRRDLELGGRGAGLHVWNSHDNKFEDNFITEMRDGLYIQNGHRNTIRRNRVTHLRYGLHYMSSDDNQFDDNLFAHNVAGAAIMYSRRIMFRRNAFIHNRGFSSFGILFQECEGVVAENNFIIDNATGVFMEALRGATFRHNVIAENDVAMQMFTSSTGNLFTENNFVENLSPLQLIGKRADARWQAGGRGNYWSDYEGYDLDGDGIGDAPHKIQNVFQYLEGNYPRLRLYLSSPAAQALATAEKTFPIVRGSTEADTAPLVKPVELSYPFERSSTKRSTQALLGAVSLAMFVVAIGVIWKGQRR
jgi:nitrous oxidase accessory protein